jgi:hypothetical protein
MIFQYVQDAQIFHVRERNIYNKVRNGEKKVQSYYSLTQVAGMFRTQNMWNVKEPIQSGSTVAKDSSLLALIEASNACSLRNIVFNKRMMHIKSVATFWTFLQFWDRLCLEGFNPEYLMARKRRNLYFPIFWSFTYRVSLNGLLVWCIDTANL